MNEEQKRYYSRLTEKIFSIPAEERGQYLADLKKIRYGVLRAYRVSDPFSHKPRRGN